DEASTRLLIDQQLRDADWVVDSVEIRYSKGVRPEKGVNKAIAEWPTESGPVDYALFLGLKLVGVIEAKKFDKPLPSVMGQAERYARDIKAVDCEFTDAGPWEDFRVPFAYITNGRPYLKQLVDDSGVHFRDLRDPTNKREVLSGWISPEGLAYQLKTDVKAIDKELIETPADLPGLRDYQANAITSVEKAIASGQKEILLAMATGTGKTRTALSLIYRLLSKKRFRRILFVVDRSELGRQASEAFSNAKLERNLTLAEMYDIKELGDIVPDPETRIQVATIQSLVKRILLSGEDDVPTIDQYDCLIVDECHRGYNLDREMEEHELEYRSEVDFISKYTRILDYFHAVKIGLTATPALHTSEIFGRPVYTYSYREAVMEGWLCDYEAPHRILTALAKSGIKWEQGDEIKLFDPKDGKVDLQIADDVVLKEVESFNTGVITPGFNQALCEELAQYLDPDIPGKALVFCANDRHADIFVKELKKAMDDQYGPQRDDLIRKITGSAMEGDSKLIRHYKNEANPKIAVTVDLLTTGVDVPEITALVFVRRVQSRILFEQMIGRATRKKDNLFGPGQHKEFFQVYDTVDLFSAINDFSTMQPVATRPHATVKELVSLVCKAEGEHQQSFHDELVAKVTRKKSQMAEKSDAFESLFDGLTVDEFFERLKSGPKETERLFDAHPPLADWIQNARSNKKSHIYISDEKDEVIVSEAGYGDGMDRPEDYLESFSKWIVDNKSTNEALNFVITQPARLSRSDLKKLLWEMGEAGFIEHHIRDAWRECRKEDCAARLIGFIRSEALGSPLIPFEQRVDAAVQRLFLDERFDWTKPKRTWLERIAKQVSSEVIVDHQAMDSGSFADAGGFDRINKRFKGQLGDVLDTLHEYIWEDAG
ncbi:MAG: type I restriction-modification system endonuclease, partial [Verrucomicrobiota bacterium]